MKDKAEKFRTSSELLRLKTPVDTGAAGKGAVFLVGCALGMAAMYFFDPAQGRSRRAKIGQKGLGWRKQSIHWSGRLAKDLANRARGSLAMLSPARLLTEVDDRTLEQRVRSRIGRKTRHPGAIEVSSARGEVTLLGPVLRQEMESLLEAVARVPGVKAVVNELEPHESAENIPALQGEGKSYLQ